jgi:replication factor A1
MTTQDLIQAILAQNPAVSEAEILEKLAAEKSRTGGLLGDETLLRLIAAKLGVQVQQNQIQNSGILSSGRLFPGLYDVTVAGRLVAVYPAKTFQGAEKSGKFASLLLGDNDGVLRVMLWNEKAEMVENGELKAGQAVRLIHGYTRVDRAGKTELHLGTKSQIEFESEGKADTYPPLEKFTIKISALNSSSGYVHLSGVVKGVFGKKTFVRNDNSEGSVMRFFLADDSGEVTVVVWDEKADEFDKNLKPNTRLTLLNVRVKEAQNGGLEVHVDSNSSVNML